MSAPAAPLDANGKSAPVLDPVERVSEIIFGLLMAMTFTGSLSVATAGREEVRTMLLTAIGCNLAWGLADAVMYLVRTMTDRARIRTLRARIHGGADAATGRQLVAEALPKAIESALGPEGLEMVRRRVLEHATQPPRPLLGWSDFKGAVGVFLLVVLATFPVVIPFLLVQQTGLALRVSNAVALGMLFPAGWMLGGHAGSSRWWGGLAMAATGAVLIVAIIALGG